MSPHTEPGAAQPETSTCSHGHAAGGPPSSPGLLVLGGDSRLLDLAFAVAAQEGLRVAAAARIEDARSLMLREPLALALVLETDRETTAADVAELREADPCLSVIVLTERAQQEPALQLLEPGSCSYLPYPLPERDLGRTLRKALQCIADRKLIEMALRQAEDRYRALFEHAVEGMFHMTPEGRFLLVNASFARMLGYETPHALVEAVTNVPRQLYVHPERHQDFRRALDAHGLVRGFEAQFFRSDRTMVWLSLNARAVHDTAGVLRCYEGTAEDIAGRKQNAERLALIDECLLRFGNDPKQNINRLTRLCGELLGADWALYSRLEDGRFHAVGRWRAPIDLPEVTDPHGHICYEVLNHGGDQAWLVRNLQDTDFAESDPCVRTYQLQTYLGHAVRRGTAYIGTVCVVYRKDSLPGPSDRRLLGIVASAIGVEEERGQAERALRQALHQTQVVLESLPNAVVVVGENLTVVSANALAGRYFDEGRRPLVGQSLSELFPEGDLKRVRLMFRSRPYAAEQGYWRQEREFQRHDRVYSYRCFPVVLQDKDRPHVGLAIWDVTEEKQLQDQLVHAEKLASLGTMVSGMAHEINNPAQAILGLAEIIMEETSPEKNREYAADIAGYALHLAAVVRDFTCYARSSSREGQDDLDLNQRLVDAVKMVRRGPHFGHIEVVTQFEPLPPLRARRSEIEQVFVNLISNAVQAMGGRGRLTLSTSRQGGRLAAVISDTGCGIPRHFLRRIFDPFFTTKDPGRGTGLGLSIVHKIVAKYRGTISVESREGAGTTFRMEFPVNPETNHKEVSDAQDE